MRSIFNQRFGIILYWYIIVTTTCIHCTNQHQQQDNRIIQNVTEQKIQKLADTRQYDKNDKNINPVNNNNNSSTITSSTSKLSVCNNCTISVISSATEQRTKQTTASSTTTISSSSSSSSLLLHQTVLQRDKNENELLSSMSKRIPQQNSNYQKQNQKSHHHHHQQQQQHSSYLLDKQKLLRPDSRNDEKIVNQVNDDKVVIVFENDDDDLVDGDEDDDYNDDDAGRLDDLSFKLDQKNSENNNKRKILSTTTPSQLPSPPSVSSIASTITTTTTTTTTIPTSTSLESEIEKNEKLKKFVNASEINNNDSQTKSFLINSVVNMNNDKLKSLSQLNTAHNYINGNVTDVDNDGDDDHTDKHHNIDIRHKNPKTNILTITNKEHTNSKNNFFYSIFHKLSLTNIFGINNNNNNNNDNVDDINENSIIVSSTTSSNSNNDDEYSNQNGYHQTKNNHIISDIDNNNIKLLYRENYDDDNDESIQLSSNYYRRTKRTKRDRESKSSIDIDNNSNSNTNNNKNDNLNANTNSNSSNFNSKSLSSSSLTNSIATISHHQINNNNNNSGSVGDGHNNKNEHEPGSPNKNPKHVKHSNANNSKNLNKIISESDIRYKIDKNNNTNNSSLISDENENLYRNYQLTTHIPSLLKLNLNDDDEQMNETLLNGFIDESKRNNIILNENLMNSNNNEPMIIIGENGEEEFDSGLGSTNLLNKKLGSKIIVTDHNKNNKDTADSEEYMHGDDPRFLPSGPIIRGPPYYDNENHPQKQQQFNNNNNDDINNSSTGDDDDDEMSVVYAEQHSEMRLTCEVNTDIATSVWFKNGQIVHTLDRNSRTVPDYRFIKEPFGGLTINNVMLEDDGEWQCEAENSRGLVKNARPIKLVVLDRPKPPYLLIDSRRLDAGNIFVPVKENSELSLACISEGGNPKPTLTWEVLLSPGVDRHAQKVAAEVLELEEIKNEKDKEPYKINSGAKSEARLPAVYRAHHNARILCVMEHPTLKIRQNASLLLDVQYTPSFAISRTPGFGYPLREGIEVSLKCDVDSNPPSTPRWQKDDGDTPVPQTGDGFLNFTSIRREHSGWYKCTSRHLNFQYSSIGYYLSVRYDSVDVTSEPDDQEVSVAASHNPNKGQLEVQLGGAVTLQCPQGSLGCWSHLDPVTARLRGLGVGLSTPTGQFSLKDVVYQDAGTYKCIGQSPNNKKKLEVLQTVGVLVKGQPTVSARNSTPVAYPGSPLHLTVEFCANPPAYAARWLHGDRVYTPGNQYGSTVFAYGVSDLPTPFCKEARLTYVHMHERVPRTFYFIVSSPGGVAEAIFKVNFTLRYRTMSNSVDDKEEELSEPEEIHFPVFGNSMSIHSSTNNNYYNYYYRITLISLITVLLSKLFIIQ